MMSRRMRKTLRGRRRRGGLTQAQLARNLGVSERTLRGWETGEHAPTWAQLDAWYAATARGGTL